MSDDTLTGIGATEVPAANAPHQIEPDQVKLTPGEVLAGRFELIERIGAGAFAQIWKAQDRRGDRIVAIKVLHPHLSVDRRNAFFHAVERMGNLQHRGIAHVFEARQEDAERFFVALEYFPNGDLVQAVLFDQLSREAGLRILIEVGDALEYMHRRGFVHGDLLPRNILLDGDNRAKLTNFNQIHKLNDDAVSQRILSTSGIYTAPEVLEGFAADIRADLFSLAMTAVFVFGEKEIKRKAIALTPEAVVRRLDVPSACHEVLLHGIARNRDDRPATVREFCEALAKSFESNHTSEPLYPTEEKIETVEQAMAKTQPQTSQAASLSIRPQKGFLHRLDHIPIPISISLGALLGLSIGYAAMTSISMPWSFFMFTLLLGGAAGIAWSGETIAVPIERKKKQAAEPEPTPRQQEEPVPQQILPSPEPEPLQRLRPELSVEMVDLTAGTFLMGSPDDEPSRRGPEGPAHEVTVSAFQCMTTPVTRRLYQEVTGKDPGWPSGDADERPVNRVSWFDAVDFCNLLSEKDGLTPFYRRLEKGTVECLQEADGYRLPTEAEWEYACRAETQTRWSFGDDEERLGEFAWFDENSDGEPRAVGQKEPNEFGLYDLHGNVWEWCWDWLKMYSEDAERNPSGPENGGYRVLRGGSFADEPGGLRSAVRVGGVPEGRNWFIGFRCVRGSGLQP